MAGKMGNKVDSIAHEMRIGIPLKKQMVVGKTKFREDMLRLLKERKGE